MSDAGLIVVLCAGHLGAMLVLVRLLAGVFADPPDPPDAGEDPPGGTLVDPAHRRPRGPGPRPARRPGPAAGRPQRRRDPHRQRRLTRVP